MNDSVHPKHTLTGEELFCLEGCRSYPQYHKMRKGFEAGICEFCHLDTELNRVLWEDDHVRCWAVHEKFLRKELKYHFIIIPNVHARSPWELSGSEMISMQEARRFIARDYDLTGGITATRFGDMRLNAGTVPHLHENIMVPNGTGEVRIPVFKDPTQRAENVDRAFKFGIRYEFGEIPQ